MHLAGDIFCLHGPHWLLSELYLSLGLLRSFLAGCKCYIGVQLQVGEQLTIILSFKH